MNPLYIGLGVGAVVLLGVVIFLASQKPVRVAVKQSVAPSSGVVPAASYEQLLTRLVTPAFEDAVDKAKAKRLHDAMLESYVKQRHPEELEAVPKAAK